MRIILFLLLFSLPCAAHSADSPADISVFPIDLQSPKMVVDSPAPGRRVKQMLPANANTELYHALYLPTDWEQGKKYPVIFEYPGNGPYRNPLGDTNSGNLEDCNLGYGASAGKGYVWVCLPFVNAVEKKQRLQWWGDVDATTAYCKAAVAQTCKDFGGDPSQLILAGFSRGAIACNFIGLRDDEIAALWRGFVVHSHYDGVRKWPYAESDAESALARLVRLKGRPQFISHELNVDATRDFLKKNNVAGNFTFVAMPFPNHTDSWVLRPTPERQKLRDWLTQVLAK